MMIQTGDFSTQIAPKTKTKFFLFLMSKLVDGQKSLQSASTCTKWSLFQCLQTLNVDKHCLLHRWLFLLLSQTGAFSNTPGSCPLLWRVGTNKDQQLNKCWICVVKSWISTKSSSLADKCFSSMNPGCNEWWITDVFLGHLFFKIVPSGLFLLRRWLRWHVWRRKLSSALTPQIAGQLFNILIH